MLPSRHRLGGRKGGFAQWPYGLSDRSL